MAFVGFGDVMFNIQSGGPFKIGLKWVLLNSGEFYTVEENLGQLQLVSVSKTLDIVGGDGIVKNNTKFVLLNNGEFYNTIK